MSSKKRHRSDTAGNIRSRKGCGLLFSMLLLPGLLFGGSDAMANVGVFANPTSHDFGKVNIGDFSVEQAFIIENGGTANVSQVNAYANTTTLLDEFGHIISSALSDEFLIQGNDCADSEIASGVSCSVGINFTPLTNGARAADLTVLFFDEWGNLGSLAVPLTGEGVGIPDIAVEPASYDFGEVQVSSTSNWQGIQIKNLGGQSLTLGELGFSGDEFELRDYCSNLAVPPSGHCQVQVKFKPESEGAKTAVLAIPSDDPDTPTIDVSLNGTGVGWCQGNYEQRFYAWPQNPDFGVDIVGADHGMRQYFYMWARGCGALRIDNMSIEGTNADEFSIKNTHCYHGSWRDYSYSSCQFKTVFSPASAGEKTADLQITFNDTTTRTVPLQAKAVDTGNPLLTVTPTSHDFGEATVDVYSYRNYQVFAIENTGDVNVYFDSINASGDTADFYGYQWSWCAYIGALNPSESCWLYAYFIPQATGARQADIVIDSSAPQTTVSLTGTGAEPADCADANITIESIASGKWADRASTSGSGQNYWYYDVYSEPVDTWKRLKNLETDENAIPNLPRSGDVVRIKAGHTVTGIPYASIRGLCIEANATLKSPSNQGAYPYMNVYATDYIENKGSILGRNGVDEDGTVSCADNYWSAINRTGCAKSGASIYLYAAAAGVRNEGTILSGHGGDGRRYGAHGGWLGIYGTSVLNTDDIGLIRAGRGGDITGTQSGWAGRGGGVSMWGNDSLTSDGIGIWGGNGGNCNSSATEAQYGGNGGNMRLNAANTVNLLDGTFATGKGGVNCEPLGTNGRDGGFNTDPPVLTISGANVQIEAGDVNIYGGDGWTLNLTGFDENTVTASGDITVAAGDGGSIDMRGGSSKAFNAEGQVNIFADSVALDEGAALTDLIDAANIVAGPSMVLRDVVIAAPGKLSGEAGDVLPVGLTVSNGSPAQDTFTLIVADSKGWTLSVLPASVQIDALGSTNLVLDVTLSATAGDTDVLSITAISESDAEITATVEVQISVATKEEVTDPGDPAISSCPTSGTINTACNNFGQTTSANVEASGSPEGGVFAGTITNQGTISQADVASGAVITGGRFTRSVTNKGTLKNFELDGGLLNGGILDGSIANTHGNIRDVALAGNASIDGGALEGDITGSQTAPATLKNLRVASRTSLANVILGENVELGAGIRFGDGVRFELPAYVPTGMDLSEMLPTVPESGGCDLDQPVSLDLSADVVKDAQGILTAINAMPGLQGVITLLQDAAHGYVYADMEGMRFAMQPWMVKHNAEDATIEADSAQSLRIRTAQRDVFTKPALQDPCGLHSILAGFGIDKWQVQDDGNVRIPVPGSNSWGSLRPDWMSALSNAPPGLNAVGDSLISQVFTDGSGTTREQVLYPAPADLAALTAFVRELGLEPVFDPQGGMSVDIGGQMLRAVFDYMVTQGKHIGIGRMQVLPLLDENGENTSDFVLVYPNGDSQRLFLDVPEEIPEEGTP
ncbi:MAG: choice-of-anchor D domain-containing protein [Gammaproteobacteria bacterium]|nr:choice-of-anchor D domain-containing protein [Gammaproteobacteria bacterium]